MERPSEKENALSHAANSTKVQLKGKILESVWWLAREEARGTQSHLHAPSLGFACAPPVRACISFCGLAGYPSKKKTSGFAGVAFQTLLCVFFMQKGCNDGRAAPVSANAQAIRVIEFLK